MLEVYYGPHPWIDKNTIFKYKNIRHFPCAYMTAIAPVWTKILQDSFGLQIE